MSAASANYVFGGQENELSRLLAQAEDLEPESAWLLDRIGVGEGWRAADIGCGPIGILSLLSRRVGPAGSVVGVERERRFADMARAEVERRALANVSIVEGDVLNAGLKQGSFDLVHERLVLINVPPLNQQALVSQMVALARIGGVIALEDWDRGTHVCFPTNTSWQILNEAYQEAARLTVGEGTTGRTLQWLLLGAGLIDVEAKVHTRVVGVGDKRRTHRLGIFSVMKSKILALGRLSESEFDSHLQAVADYLADPRTLLIDQLFVQAWGRRR